MTNKNEKAVREFFEFHKGPFVCDEDEAEWYLSSNDGYCVAGMMIEKEAKAVCAILNEAWKNRKPTDDMNAPQKPCGHSLKSESHQQKLKGK